MAALEEEALRARREAAELTQRLALTEDVSGLVSKRIGALKAQQQIIAIVRQLEAEGVVSLKGAVGEQYVV